MRTCLNTVLVFILLFCFVSCDPSAYFTHQRYEHQGLWYIKNLTDRPLIIESSDFYIRDTVEPGDSVAVAYKFLLVEEGTKATFGHLYTTDSISVYDVGGHRLKNWKPAKKENTEEDFLRESSWFNFIKKYDEKTVYYWVYPLREENLEMTDIQ